VTIFWICMLSTEASRIKALYIYIYIYIYIYMYVVHQILSFYIFPKLAQR
jgi:hypothetical protein